MTWSTARKERARDRAAQLGAMQAAVTAVAREIGAAGVRVWLMLLEGLRLARRDAIALMERRWVKVTLTVAFVVLLLAGMGKIESLKL